MQRLITSIFIVIFATFAVFGLSFMAHQDSAAHDGCLAGGLLGSACAQDIGAFSMIALHFSALAQFSSAVFLNFLTIDLLILLGAFLLIVFCIGSHAPSNGFAIVMRSRRSFDLWQSTFRQCVTDWLALHTRRNPSPLCVFNF